MGRAAHCFTIFLCHLDLDININTEIQMTIQRPSVWQLTMGTGVSPVNPRDNPLLSAIPLANLESNLLVPSRQADTHADS